MGHMIAEREQEVIVAVVPRAELKPFIGRALGFFMG